MIEVLVPTGSLRDDRGGGANWNSKTCKVPASQQRTCPQFIAGRTWQSTEWKLCYKSMSEHDMTVSQVQTVIPFLTSVFDERPSAEPFTPCFWDAVTSSFDERPSAWGFTPCFWDDAISIFDERPSVGFTFSLWDDDVFADLELWWRLSNSGAEGCCNSTTSKWRHQIADIHHTHHDLLHWAVHTVWLMASSTGYPTIKH